RGDGGRRGGGARGGWGDRVGRRLRLRALIAFRAPARAVGSDQFGAHRIEADGVAVDLLSQEATAGGDPGPVARALAVLTAVDEVVALVDAERHPLLHGDVGAGL